MNYNDINERVHSLYEMILANPLPFAGRGSIEQVVFGFEMILNAVAGTNDRPDGYRRFLQERSFGMFPFDAKFESAHRCVLSFVDIDTYNNSRRCVELNDEYVCAFSSHWREFLEWRKLASIVA